MYAEFIPNLRNLCRIFQLKGTRNSRVFAVLGRDELFKKISENGDISRKILRFFGREVAK